MKKALLIACLLAVQPSWAGTLDVAVSGVPDARGHVRVAVCERAEFLRPHCLHHAFAPAVAGTTMVRVPDLPPGIYAVQAWHDANDNGRIDRNWLGLPTEAIGFSRDAPMRFGPPRFDDAAISVGPIVSRFALRLRSF